MCRRLVAPALLSLAYALSSAPLFAQTRITTPKEEFGANYGDDYFLANYTQIAAYWRKLERESPRMKVQVLGKTAEGRDHLMAIVTSPENQKNLARYKEISSRLSHAEGLTDDQARALAKEGKTVVWIDGGLHANEVLGAQQLGEMVYQMVSRNDEETQRFLNDVILLLVHANPDGNELVANWYMRDADPLKRTLNGLPRLYQKYIGHDNNREFFTSTQAETENINRVLYHEWFPQLLYNHHQSGPAGTVVYSPPFRDPYNYNLDPLMLLGIQAMGTAMHTRLAIENKPGATMRSGGPYDGWWNGGIRNTATFHNTIALLTEMIGSPTPMRIPLVKERQIPSGDLAMPIAPQEWRFNRSIDYSISLNRGVLDHASRERENLLFNMYRMGKNSIERGSRDTWTANPRRDAAVAARMAPAGGAGAGGGRGGRGGGATGEQDAALWAAQHTPDMRDPRGYIIPSDQEDFPTAIKFVNSLRETGISIQRAKQEFDVAGKHYPAGSFVVKTAQAFRPHVIDMFEPQVHPDVFLYPGSAPTPPYDNAGWTLAFQMGIKFDRVLTAFDGPFENVTAWNVAPPRGNVATTNGASAFLLNPRPNDSFVAVNRLLKNNDDVRRFTAPATINGVVWPSGTIYVKSGRSTRAALDSIAGQLGLNFVGTKAAAPATARKLRTMRVGLWDQYGGSMPSGWTRWILEQFEFPFTRVFAPELDAGNLSAKYDVLVFVDGGIALGGGGGRGGGGGAGGEEPANLPAEYRGQFGRVSADKTIPQLREFMNTGGTVVAIGGSATGLAAQLKLPVESALMENGAPLPRTKFYVPGSVLSSKVNTANELGAGMTEYVDMFFDDSPVFKLTSAADANGVKAVAWFDNKAPLRSGWAWGQQYLDQGVTAIEATVGTGRAVLFGPEILQRAQPHGTFKFLFNSIITARPRP